MSRCPDSPNGEHEPDSAELSPSDGATVNLIFYCVHCNAAGSAEIKVEAIKWEDAEDSDEVDDEDDEDEDNDDPWKT